MFEAPQSPYLVPYDGSFRMTDANMASQPTAGWSGFWQVLKRGHDLFEQSGWQPPEVGVCGSDYVFGDRVARCQKIAGW